MGNEYARILRLGESRRDASSKIRGFLFQDLIALNKIINDDKNSDIFIEWVEDIFIENDNDVVMIQVKYFPKSSVPFSDIYEDMFYQFIKVKLLCSNKNVQFKCIHKSDTDFDKEKCVDILKGKFVDSKLNEKTVTEIWSKLDKKTNFTSRKDYLIKNLGCVELLEEFEMQVDLSEDFSILRGQISDSLYKNLKKKGALNSFNENAAKALLLSCSIDYVQKKYYSNNNDIKNRIIRKSEIINYINNLFERIDNRLELITSVIFRIIDDLFQEIVEFKDDYSDDVFTWYSDLYIETKKFFSHLCEDKNKRFKFINTVATHEEKKNLNNDLYCSFDMIQERELFIRNTDNLRSYFLFIWKLLYNTNYDKKVDLSEYIIEVGDVLLFGVVGDPHSPIYISSSIQRNVANRNIIRTIERIENIKDRPTKWYMGIPNNKMGIISYSYSVSNIREKMNAEDYDYDDLTEDYFILECMDCLKCNTYNQEMSSNDDLKNCIFMNICNGGN